MSEPSRRWLAFFGDDRWRGLILMTCGSAWSKRSKRARRGGRRPTALRSPRALRSNGCSVGARAEASQQSRPGGAFRRSRSTRPACSLSLPSSRIGRWRRWSRRCTNVGSPVVVPRSGASSSDTRSALKKKPARDGTRARGRGSSAPALDQATALSGHDRAGLPR